MLEPDELTRQDAEFSERLARRDKSVLGCIDRCYSRALRHLLRRLRGPLLSDEDIDEVLEKAILETWRGYRRETGAPVRWFYFRVGKRRVQDHLRRAGRLRQQMLDAAPKLAVRSDEGNVDAPGTVEIAEERAIDLKLRRLLDKAVEESLTDRQRLAFNRRFAAGGGEHWAKQLEHETEIPAQSWRKASDEAKANVAAYLQQKGVEYSREGGRYVVAEARSSA